ncbi:hypothetical protein GOV12_00855 [Candidatus Pacearchaeota archaeon]|nr:hypothetical protein [Candidatus Pacearchaeota archaeon]
MRELGDDFRLNLGPREIGFVRCMEEVLLDEKVKEVETGSEQGRLYYLEMLGFYDKYVIPETTEEVVDEVGDELTRFDNLLEYMRVFRDDLTSLQGGLGVGRGIEFF